MIEGWQEKITEAQRQTHAEGPDGRLYARIPHDGDGRRCHDCAVEPGQLHVQSCTVERCPVCGGQAWGCCTDNAHELA